MRYTDKKPYVEEMHLSGVNRQRIYKQSFVHDPFFVDFNTLRFDRSADNVTPDKTPFSMLLDIRLSKNRLKIRQTNNKQQQTNKKRQKKKKTNKKKKKTKKNKKNNTRCYLFSFMCANIKWFIAILFVNGYLRVYCQIATIAIKNTTCNSF